MPSNYRQHGASKYCSLLCVLCLFPNTVPHSFTFEPYSVMRDLCLQSGSSPRSSMILVGEIGVGQDMTARNTSKPTQRGVRGYSWFAATSANTRNPKSSAPYPVAYRTWHVHAAHGTPDHLRGSMTVCGITVCTSISTTREYRLESLLRSIVLLRQWHLWAERRWKRHRLMCARFTAIAARDLGTRRHTEAIEGIAHVYTLGDIVPGVQHCPSWQAKRYINLGRYPSRAFTNTDQRLAKHLPTFTLALGSMRCAISCAPLRIGGHDKRRHIK